MEDSPYYFETLVRSYLEMKTKRQLTTGSFNQVLEIARKESVKLHFLKRLENPRMTWAVSLLKGLRPGRIIDVGTGKGYILWHLLENIPEIDLVAVDFRPRQVSRINEVSKAADLPILAIRADAQRLPLGNNTCDSVTLLEVLEHTTEPNLVIREAIRVSRQWVIISVPSHEDSNPDHRHTFTREGLSSMLTLSGASKIRIDQDSHHIYVQARV